MSKNKKYNKEGYTGNPEEGEVENVEHIDPSSPSSSDESTSCQADVVDAEPDADAENEIERLKAEIDKEKKEYLFLMAEFDNFRKRTLREKSELIKNGGETVLKGLLPILDDFERGLKASEKMDDSNSVREGMELIYHKLKKYLEQNGVKEFDPDDKEFDAERHEAISAVPVPDESLKGKILDTVEKGYMINDKVLRHAKVVVGQ